MDLLTGRERFGWFPGGMNSPVIEKYHWPPPKQHKKAES